MWCYAQTITLVLRVKICSIPLCLHLSPQLLTMLKSSWPCLLSAVLASWAVQENVTNNNNGNTWIMCDTVKPPAVTGKVVLLILTKLKKCVHFLIETSNQQWREQNLSTHNKTLTTRQKTWAPTIKHWQQDKTWAPTIKHWQQDKTWAPTIKHWQDKTWAPTIKHWQDKTWAPTIKH